MLYSKNFLKKLNVTLKIPVLVRHRTTEPRNGNATSGIGYQVAYSSDIMKEYSVGLCLTVVHAVVFDACRSSSCTANDSLFAQYFRGCH